MPFAIVYLPACSEGSIFRQAVLRVSKIIKQWMHTMFTEVQGCDLKMSFGIYKYIL